MLSQLSTSRLHAKTSVEEMEDFLVRHKEEREEAVLGGSHRKQYRRFGRPHKTGKGPVTRSGRPLQSPLASRSGASKTRSPSLVGVELDGHGWGRGRYSGGPSATQQLQHAASIATKVDSTQSKVRLEDQVRAPCNCKVGQCVFLTRCAPIALCRSIAQCKAQSSAPL